MADSGTLLAPTTLLAGPDQPVSGDRPAGGWVATFDPVAPPDPDTWSPAGWYVERPARGTPGLVLAVDPDATPPLYARDRSLQLVFDGVLVNRTDLQEQLGLREAAVSTAALVLAAYRRWNERAFERLRGHFVVLLHDRERQLLFALRDQMGMWPLFRARAQRALLFSPVISVLTRHPGVSSEVDRLVLAEHLISRFPVLEDTYFAAVKRVPPGHVLRVAPQTEDSKRYWTPASTDWAGEDALEQFEELFERAIARCMSLGPVGLFLSGGLDSVSIGALATDLARRTAQPVPRALCVGFPYEGVNEEPVQRGVADSLGLPIEFQTFEEALPAGRLLASALEMGRWSSMPTDNVWAPVYTPLRHKARAAGCRVVLTGSGGDELLTVTPYLAADLIRRGDLIGLVRLMNSFRRSYPLNRLAPLRTAWRYGVLPLLGAMADWTAPTAYTSRRTRLVIESTPTWLAPDPALRKAMDERAHLIPRPPRPPRGFYLRDADLTLDHPLMSIEREETFQVDRRTGLVTMHPYWDVDLTSLLYRIPVTVLSRGGRSKGLVREAMSRRFPGLGFERQKKINATGLYEHIIYTEAHELWRGLARPMRLATLGIVDENAVEHIVHRILAARPAWQGWRIWTLLNLETWAHHKGSQGRSA